MAKTKSEQNMQSDSAPSSPQVSPSSRRSRARLTIKEDLEQQLQTLIDERDAAVAERMACEVRCDSRVQEMEQETTALRLLLEEEGHRTDTLAEHVEYLGHLLEEKFCGLRTLFWRFIDSWLAIN